MPRASQRGLTRRRLLRAGTIVGGGIAALAIGGTAAYVGTRYPPSPPQSGWLALRADRVLRGPHLAPSPGVVLVRDGKIVAVGPRVGVPSDAEVVDLPDATILPGLIDMHSHLAFPDLEPDEELGATDYPGFLWDAVRYMPRMRRDMLAHGVTTVRSLGDELAWVLDLRATIASGELEGPRVFCAGPVLTTPSGHPITTHNTGADSDAVRLPGTPQRAEEIVAELLDGDRPVDLVKIIQESGAVDHPLGPHDPAILAVITAAAHERGVPVTVHCGTARDMAQAVEAGADGVEHLTLRDPAATLADITRTAGVAWPPGLLEHMAEQGTVLDPTLVVEWRNRASESPAGAEARNRIHQRLLEAHRVGVPIVAGSDAAVPGIPYGLGLVQEIEALGSAGLTNREALRTATVQAARTLGSSDIGVIEPGRAADLLVVGGDPLTDLHALHAVRAVFRDGRRV